MKAVSVILPVYNGARFIPDALASVFDQSFADYEVICVNDGSTDHSLEVLDQFARRITIITQSNAGQGAARNAGVRHATGSYIAFIDQDDRWYPLKLEQQVAAMQSDPDAVLVYCNSDRMDSDGRLVQIGATVAEHERAMASPLGRLLGHGLILPSAMLVRREAYERVGGFDDELRGYEDFDLCARLQRQGRFLFLKEPGMCYRVHAQGFSTAGGHAVVRSRERFLLRMRELYRGESRKVRIIDRLLAECYSDWGMYEMKRGNLKEGRRMWVRALHCDPFKFRTYSRLIRSFSPGFLCL